jgi:hypothetical protein
MANRNFAIEDETYSRLKIRAAQFDVTIGKAIEILIDNFDAALEAEQDHKIEIAARQMLVERAEAWMEGFLARQEARRAARAGGAK